MREYTYIDLFSGPGGLCTGFISEGFVPRIAVEWSDTTVVTYAKSHDAEIYELQDLLANIGQLENILKKTKSLIFRYKGENMFQALISTSVHNYHLYLSTILNRIDTYFILLC